MIAGEGNFVLSVPKSSAWELPLSLNESISKYGHYVNFKSSRYESHFIIPSSPEKSRVSASGRRLTQWQPKYKHRHKQWCFEAKDKITAQNKTVTLKIWTKAASCFVCSMYSWQNAALQRATCFPSCSVFSTVLSLPFACTNYGSIWHQKG